MRLLPQDPSKLRIAAPLAREAAWIARALLILAPLLLLFGGLFIAADAVFEHLASGLLHLDLNGFRTHFSWFFCCSWASLGLIWGLLAFEPLGAPAIDIPDEGRLRPLEVTIILGALALLFGAFVLVQVRYLFGGHALVERTARLTYAQYARRGFFELVAVAALLMPVLLAVDWARTVAGSRVFRALAACLVALLFVVIASDLQRMHVYAQTYGLTELRFYVLASLFAIAMAFLWLAATVLRGRPALFLAGCLGIGAVLIVAVTALNPDAVIASTNLARAADAQRLDARYLGGLGADAVPSVVARIDSIPAADRCSVATALLGAWGGPLPDLRAWTWADYAARASVRSHRSALEASCGAATPP